MSTIDPTQPNDGTPLNQAFAKVRTQLNNAKSDIETLETWLNSIDPDGDGDVSETAAEILAKLLTVDGSESGLDADFLRGQSPAQLIPANVWQSINSYSDYELDRVMGTVSPPATIPHNFGTQNLVVTINPTDAGGWSNYSYYSGTQGPQYDYYTFDDDNNITIESTQGGTIRYTITKIGS